MRSALCQVGCLMVALGMVLSALTPVWADADEEEIAMELVMELKVQAEQLYEAGKYAEAIPLFKKVLTIVEQVFGPEDPATAVSLSNLAQSYKATGAYAQAEPLFQRALAIHEQVSGPEDPSMAETLNNLASLYHATGAYAQAEPLYQRALAINEKVLGPEDPTTATSLNNLAGLYDSTGAYAQAEPLYQRALAINEKVLGPEDPTTAASLDNLAGVYRTTRAYAKAEPLHQRALAIRQKVLGPDHPDTATSLNNLAALYDSTGAYAQAEPLYQRALAIYEKVLGPEHPATARGLNNLGAVAWGHDDRVSALTYHQRAVHIEEVNARRVLVQGDDTRKRAYMATLEGSTHGVVSFAVASARHMPAATSLGLEVVLQRKGRVLDVLTDSLARLRKSVAPDDQALMTRYQAATTDLATLTTRGTGNPPVDQYRVRLAKLQGQVTALETKLSTHSRRFRAEIDPITLPQVQRAIPHGAVLLEWVHYQPFNPKAIKQEPRWGMPRYAVFLLKRQGAPILVDLGDAEPIETRVAELLAAVRHPGRTHTVQLLAQALEQLLLQPLRANLGPAQQLLLSPDGALNLLPFGVLQDANGYVLAEQYELTYLTSGRDLLRPAAPARTSKPTLLVADPDFGPLKSSLGTAAVEQRRSVDFNRGSLRFGPLTGTAQEAQALRTLLKLNESQVLTQGRATETALKQVHGPKILHLATHGFFLTDLPEDLNASSRGAGLEPTQRPSAPQGENPLLRSGLALAGANQLRSGPADDGILTALEVASLDLQETELAVLSACETGVGQVHNGEGVYGLRRALVLAGVRTQVTSLWKVDDAATKEFMVAYYAHVQAGRGRSAALRAVQRSMRQNPQRAHPYYWAAFVVIGDAAPLPRDHAAAATKKPK